MNAETYVEFGWLRVSPIFISEKIRKICENFLKILIFRKRIEVSGI